MIATCLRAGCGAALANWRLILTLWAWSGVAAIVAGAGVWRWLSTAFDYAPEADRLLERFHFGLVIELIQYDRFSPLTLLYGAALGLLVVATVSNPLVAGGVLEVLVSRDDRRLLHRFLRGAGRFFGRFLRLVLITAIAALILSTIARYLTTPAVRALSDSSWERAAIAAALGGLLLMAAAVGLTVVILDFARVRVAVENPEMRRMTRAWLGAARFVFRNFGPVVGVYVTYAILIGTAFAIYAAIANLLPVRSWAEISGLVLLQQLFVVTRAAFGVARQASAVELWRLRAPAPAPEAPMEAPVPPPVQAEPSVP